MAKSKGMDVSIDELKTHSIHQAAKAWGGLNAVIGSPPAEKPDAGKHQQQQKEQLKELLEQEKKNSPAVKKPDPAKPEAGKAGPSSAPGSGEAGPTPKPKKDNGRKSNGNGYHNNGQTDDPKKDHGKDSGQKDKEKAMSQPGGMTEKRPGSGKSVGLFGKADFFNWQQFGPGFSWVGDKEYIRREPAGASRELGGQPQQVPLGEREPELRARQREGQRVRLPVLVLQELDRRALEPAHGDLPRRRHGRPERQQPPEDRAAQVPVPRRLHVEPWPPRVQGGRELHLRAHPRHHVLDRPAAAVRAPERQPHLADHERAPKIVWSRA